MMKFNGERWELFGPILEDAGPGGLGPAIQSKRSAERSDRRSLGAADFL